MIFTQAKDYYREALKFGINTLFIAEVVDSAN